MEAKEKAKELTIKAINALMDSGARIGKNDIKAVCLFCVNTHIYSENDSPFPTMNSWVENERFWNEVKKEIEKI